MCVAKPIGGMVEYCGLSANWHGLCFVFRGGAIALQLETNWVMNTIAQSRLLQMRSSIVGQNSALQRAAGRTLDPAGGAAAPPVDFGKSMTDALQAVNAQQTKATELSSAYERGDTHDIVSVMVERQKASLGFEATLQARNKLLSAYRDIMNMPV
jgi:flagellar hook-basal body complex protein FliE